MKKSFNINTKIKGNFVHYYYKKYPYLQYDYKDADGFWTMFSVPPAILASAFLKHFDYYPRTFFDCGAATGEIVYRAEKLGMIATGIDIKRYPYQNENLGKLFTDGKIQIKSILDCEPIRADLAFCNGTLTYFSENELSQVLEKFQASKMLIAIHNTTEDVNAARKQGDKLLTCNKPRLIRKRDWWINTFVDNGFSAEYDKLTRCFYVLPKTR
ncbi:MAG: hypothetical protein IK122_01170 [Alphaproteobacteria bacterium]|nr:hypothetical protein [Alphaproteobacteria bacterium]